MLTNGLRILSDALGWSYFVLWSVSFYPQAILNYKRKSVEGELPLTERYERTTNLFCQVTRLISQH